MIQNMSEFDYMPYHHSTIIAVMELNKKYLQIQGKESMTKGDR